MTERYKGTPWKAYNSRLLASTKGTCKGKYNTPAPGTTCSESATRHCQRAGWRLWARKTPWIASTKTPSESRVEQGPYPLALARRRRTTILEKSSPESCPEHDHRKGSTPHRSFLNGWVIHWSQYNWAHRQNRLRVINVSIFQFS
jgi:hypothetical protein